MALIKSKLVDTGKGALLGASGTYSYEIVDWRIVFPSACRVVLFFGNDWDDDDLLTGSTVVHVDYAIANVPLIFPRDKPVSFFTGEKHEAFSIFTDSETAPNGESFIRYRKVTG